MKHLEGKVVIGTGAAARAAGAVGVGAGIVHVHAAEFINGVELPVDGGGTV